ncbi:hypothetical protein GDO78_023073 [Eleutherodactylus coqui]|uniref:Uncharacterized protein n=1 Tax=Eleutherodactylus coqui TaxID=57060 RepID=A0A8J6JY64_ELECQ|nr:hypothetical protein GDO78_023073 [Eleutherodactylus coqui]
MFPSIRSPSSFLLPWYSFSLSPLSSSFPLPSVLLSAFIFSPSLCFSLLFFPLLLLFSLIFCLLPSSSLLYFLLSTPLLSLLFLYSPGLLSSPLLPPLSPLILSYFSPLLKLCFWSLLLQSAFIWRVWSWDLTHVTFPYLLTRTEL